MAVTIKTKCLDFLRHLGGNENGVKTLESQGVQMVKGGVDTVLHWKDRVWVLKGAGHGEVDAFILAVLDDIMTAKESSNVTVKVAEPPPGVVPEVLPLREAKAMYQRVAGTSGGSVYVVVAVSPQRDIQVAAKITGNNLSVRVEGNGLTNDQTRTMLAGQALSYKLQGGYMSGHYVCDHNAPPAKVLGSILLGSGISFNTPLPDVSKVAKVSA